MVCSITDFVVCFFFIPLIKLTDNISMNITESMIKAEPMDNALSPYNHNIYTTSPSAHRNSLSPNIPYDIIQNTTNPTTYNTQNIQNTTSYTTTAYPTHIGHGGTTSNLQQQRYSMQNTFNIPPITESKHHVPVQLPSISTMNVVTGSPFVVPHSTITSTTIQQQNINASSTTANESNSSANLSGLFNLDDRQFTQINSSDLTGLSLSLLDGTYATNDNQLNNNIASNNDNVNTNNDTNDPNMEYDNMTDSFTRCVIKELNDLNNSTY